MGVMVVAAPDKMRGTATARELAAAVASVVERRGGTCVEVPMSDGGEGFLDVLGGANRTSTVTGPLGDPVVAPWRLSGREAVIEMSRASGLDLVVGLGAARAGAGLVAIAGATHPRTVTAADPDPTHPRVELTIEEMTKLIGEALDSGARRILVGIGGSATTDGGLGALRALYPTTRLRGIDLVVACDVELGFVDSAEVFAPQKGASASQVALLRRRLERLAEDFLDQRLQAGFVYGDLAGIQPRNLLLVDITANHLVPGLRETGADDETDISGPYNRYVHVHTCVSIKVMARLPVVAPGNGAET